MKHQQNKSRTLYARSLKLFFAIALLGNSMAYGAALGSPGIRVTVAGDKFDGVTQLAATFELATRRILNSHHFELAVGSISSSNGTAAFTSVGPVWRTPFLHDRLFVDFGISPTFISGSKFSGRELGGHGHFTSFISMGLQLGRSGAVTVRIQHTSNGGLNETNPGLDMAGLQYKFNFSR